VLVVEHGHRLAAALDDGHDLVEELLPRIHRLAQLAARIAAMLADQRDGVDGHRFASEAERLIDRLEKRYFEPLRRLAGHVAIWKLIGIERNYLDARIRPLAAKQVRAHQAREDVKRVRSQAKFGENGRYLWPWRVSRSAARCKARRGSRCGGEFDPISSR
jgi:hypothetical protein